MRLVVDVCQAVFDHAVLELDGSEFHARPARHVMGHGAHVLHATSHDHVGISKGNCLAGQCNGLHAAGADLVDCGTRHVLSHAGAHGSLSSRCLPSARLEDVAHEHFVNQGGVHVALGQRTSNGRAAEGSG